MAGDPTWTDTPVAGKTWSNHVYGDYVVTPFDATEALHVSPDGETIDLLADVKTYVEAQYTAAQAAEPLTIECKVLADLFDYEDPYGGPRLQAYEGDTIFMLEPQAVALTDDAAAAGIEADIELIGTPST